MTQAARTPKLDRPIGRHLATQVTLSDETMPLHLWVDAYTEAIARLEGILPAPSHAKKAPAA